MTPSSSNSTTTPALEQRAGYLPATEPFDFNQTLGFLAGFPATAGEQQISPEGQLTKVISLKGQALVFTVENGPASQPPGISYTFWATQLSPEIISLAERAISKYLGLQDDLSELYQVGANDPAFAPVLQKLYGYHQVRFLTPFENAAWAILSQRTLLSVARTLKTKLITQYGPSLELPDGKRYTAFPEPEALLAVFEQDGGQALLKLINNERKVNYLFNLAQAFATSLRFDDPAVDQLDRATLKQKLLAIKGIGEWSAEFVLIRGFGQMGGIPQGEQALAKAATRWYAPLQAGLLSDEAIADYARPYGSSKGYWAHYLRAAGSPD